MCYVKVAGSINICIHVKIVVQPQVIDNLAHFIYVNTNMIGLPQHFVLT
jgi:chorismate mutase